MAAVYQKPVYNVVVGDEILYTEDESGENQVFKKVVGEPLTVYSPIDTKKYGTLWYDGDLIFELEDGTYTGGDRSTIITVKDQTVEE